MFKEHNVIIIFKNWSDKPLQIENNVKLALSFVTFRIFEA